MKEKLLECIKNSINKLDKYYDEVSTDPEWLNKVNTEYQKIDVYFQTARDLYILNNEFIDRVNRAMNINPEIINNVQKKLNQYQPAESWLAGEIWARVKEIKDLLNLSDDSKCPSTLKECYSDIINDLTIIDATVKSMACDYDTRR